MATGLVEILALVLIGCGGGGGGDSGPDVPLLPWPRLRRSDTNIGLGVNNIADNEGVPGLVYEFDGETPTDSPPLLGRDSSIYLPLDDQVISFDASNEEDVRERWRISECRTDDQTALPIGSISSLSIAINGLDLVIGSTGASSGGGHIFRFLEPEDGDDPPQCLFAFPAGSRSSALASVDGLDLELLSLVTGTTSGRLTSLNARGARRWSFPENESFGADLSSSPAVLGTSFVFTSPDGRLHSVDQSGRSRWSAVIGTAYPPDEVVPSPVVLDQIFTVNAAGDVVATTPTGTHLWTFEPDAPIVGSPAASGVTIEGGAFVGQNMVIALDGAGTIYGIGSLTGELIRLCEADNRACRPSTCENEAPCEEFFRCSETADIKCNPGECPPGESCTEQFFCSNDENDPAFDRACAEDFCLSDESGEDGLCKREAKLPLAVAEFATSPILSPDGFVIAATTDGSVCARRIDGSVPNGNCAGSGANCTPDSCGPPDDTCCDDRSDNPSCKLGHCRADPDRPCSLDTCDEGEGPCETNWRNGCIELGVGGTSPISSPVIDRTGGILVTTEIGLAIVE